MKRTARIGLWLGLCGVFGGWPVVSCTTPSEVVADAGRVDPDADVHDATVHDAIGTLSPDAMLAGSFCALPGSVVATAQGMAVVQGGDPSLPDLSWLTVPVGYCIHHFANVPETRQLRFSPGGDLFVASPSTRTAGGEANTGAGDVLVLPDDDHDGLADAMLPFLPLGEAGPAGLLPSTQGLAFAAGYFYFQDGVTIRRVAFKQGDRAPSAPIEAVTTITAPQWSGHWPKLVDMAMDGTVYVTNGSDQSEQCLSARPVNGAVFQVLPGGATSLVAKGFRNPIALRCEANHNVCLVAELAKDGTDGSGGREKLVPVRQGDDWGFPCCATTNLPYSGMEFQNNGQSVQPSDCASVTQETVSFEIGHTPFGLDFEIDPSWPSPWAGRVFVTLHGDVGSYVGSRVVGIALDPSSGMPLPTSDMQGVASAMPNMMDFVTGWDDGRQDHGRATAITFGPDGRMYIGDDTKGEIFWIAPVDLMRP